MLLGRVSATLNSPSRWSASLYVDNVNNEQGAYLKDQGGIPNRDMRVRPRTVGLQLDYRQ
jgi:hypothetical protein